MDHNPFTHHPASVGETYWQHLLASARFAALLGVAAVAALVHAVLPFLFEKTASEIITTLHRRMVTHRRSEGD